MSEEINGKQQGRRGRPLGFKLSLQTKDKIRKKRTGTFHTEETKEKISKSLAKYFRKRDPLTNSLEYDYRFSQAEVYGWIGSNSISINACDDILTNKRIVYLNQLEQSFGEDIERFFSHNMTPEFILLLKEELISKGLLTELEFVNAVL